MPDGYDTTGPTLMDTSSLGTLLKQRRTENNLSLRQAAALADVSFSTFSRVEGGAQPDLATFLRLCAWLGVSPNAFFQTGPTRQTTGVDAAITHLSADPMLSDDAAGKIAGVIRTMYDALATQASAAKPALTLHLRAASAMRPGVPDRLAGILTDMHARLTQLVDAGDI